MTVPAAQPAAAPATGTLPWYAWLFSPPEARPLFAALFGLDGEWRSIVATQMDHGVAHLKLQWWKDELGRLDRDEPRHPLTTFLARSRPGATSAWQALGDRLSSLDFDLACAGYPSQRELDAYFARADGLYRALVELLLRGQVAGIEAAARSAGQAIRMIECIRDLRQDATDGRVHLPLDWLTEAGVTPLELRSADAGPGARRCLERFAHCARDRWQQARRGINRAGAPTLRGLRVHGELHLALLRRIERERFAVGTHRIVLGPAASLWTAWRAARQH